MQFFWEKAGWEADDPQLKTLNELPFFRKLAAPPKQSGLYSIRGPRQIGKSTWLKIMLSHYVKKNKKCFYYSCEPLADYKELTTVLTALPPRDVILLDEITFVKDWDRSIKPILDQKKIPIVIITGSNQVDLRRGIDQMPGRWGAGGEWFLFPMSYTEFLDVRAQARWISEDPFKELLLYFKVGGFPNAILEAGKSGKNPVQAKNTYLKWILGDGIKLGKNEHYLKELLSQLALTHQSPVSLQTLAKKTQIGSHHTIADYIQLLEDFFVLNTLYALDPNSGAYLFRRDKKFYFRDPLIYWIAYGLSGKKKDPENWDSVIAELVAAEAISMKMKKCGYYSSKNGEVDFYFPGEWAIEVKWALTAHNLSKLFYTLNVPEKIVWTQTNFLSHWPQLRA